jgi:uncharacterized protein (DUF1800 family)
MFDPVLAEIRFGMGLSPKVAPPKSVDQMLHGLGGVDIMARRFPIPGTATFQAHLRAEHSLRKIMRRSPDEQAKQAARADLKVLRRDVQRLHRGWAVQHLLRAAHTPTGFRERLEQFWADHFTTVGRGTILQFAGSSYRESAIRPHMTGPFEQLLYEAITHPLMVTYLDQSKSAGPNSDQVARKPDWGLNENLAREILELHTLGPDGPYDQADVRELAELLTGLSISPKNGRVFKRGYAEPGAETVLGKRYEGRAGLRNIWRLLRDLARHPATAQHMAHKLVVHFVSDQPDAGHVAAVARAWRESGADLMAVYRALLSHPAAWGIPRRNVKSPLLFVASACRALALPEGALPEGKVRDYVFTPLRQMGQVWQSAPGPDGLPETDSAWITPQGVAARLQWALSIPQLLRPDLPDPRAFLDMALGSLVPQSLRFAAQSAESRADGIGLILASPAFQRM